MALGADMTSELWPLGGVNSKIPKFQMPILELVSKELNHLAAILHVYAGGFNFMK